MVTPECFSSRPNRVERVGLRSPRTGHPQRSIEFDHPLAGLDQDASESGAVTPGPFQGPGSQSRVGLAELEQGRVSIGIRRHRVVFESAACRCRDHRRGVGVLVRVDADDDVDELCQHGHALSPWPEGRVGSGSGGDGRTVMGHAERPSRRSSS